MQQLSKLLITRVTRPNIIRKLNTNSSNKPYKYKFSTKKSFTELIQHIFQDLNNWYVNIIGLAEVQKYQERVEQVQSKLLETQEKRREVSKQLAELRIKSNELQDQLLKLKREDDIDKFIDAMREETETLRKEKEVSRMFNEYDRAERDLFTVFTNAVRESHEKQRSQLEYTKYLGLALSIVGSFLAFCYSSLKKHELKSFIDQKLSVYPVPVSGNIMETHKELRQQLDVLKSDTTKLFTQNINIVKDNHKELKNMLNTLNNKHKSIPKSNSFVQEAPPQDLPDNRELIEWGLASLFASIVIGLLSCCCCR